MKKTQLDLHLSAAKAAAASIETVSSFDVENNALNTFKGESQNPLDWDYWKGQHDNLLGQYRRMKTVNAASATAQLQKDAEAKEAQAKAKAVKAPAPAA